MNLRGKNVWTVTITNRYGTILVRYMVVARSVADASNKATKLARSTWGRDSRVSNVEHEGTIDA